MDDSITEHYIYGVFLVVLVNGPIVEGPNTFKNHGGAKYMLSRINIIDPNPTNRAKMNRELLPICKHIEIFEDIRDFITYLPKHGLVLVNNQSIGVAELFEALSDVGRWFPIVAYDEEAAPDRVVDAIGAGAIDFFSWPLQLSQIESRIVQIEKKSATIGEQMIAKFDAQAKIADLSPRESQVLEALAAGNSNKGIAKLLNLSPRTIEIHRANMMGKLNASHSSEAVRIAADAGLTNRTPDQGDEASLAVSMPEASPSTMRHIMQ